MARISGIDLNPNKRIDIALTKIFGLGRANVVNILKAVSVEASIRVKDIKEEDINKIQKIVDNSKVEGDLRREISDNIKRMKELGAYRGLRHAHNLPVRGQRTRSNARTKRGKRLTIGAIKKEMAQKMGISTDDSVKKEEKK